MSLDAIRSLDRRSLQRLLVDLYDRSPENRRFVKARLRPDACLDEYRNVVASLMDPRDATRPQIAAAKRALADFRKATGDLRGEVDLMIHFVECGNAFTLRYGDVDAGFYDSLVRMYERAVQRVKALPETERGPFVSRLGRLVESTTGLGWGYHDALSDAFQEAFPTLSPPRTASAEN